MYRQGAAGDFLAGQNMDQLVLGTRWVSGGNDHHLQTGVAAMLLQCGDGLRFVVFNADQAAPGTCDLQQDQTASDNVSGAFAQQRSVGGDERLALRCIQHQGINLLQGRAQFQLGRKAGAAEAAYAGIGNTFDQRVDACARIIKCFEFGPAGIGGVGVDDHAQLRQSGCIRYRISSDGADNPCRRRMRQQPAALGCVHQCLPLVHAITNLHAQLRCCIVRLRHRYCQLWRQRGHTDRPIQ